MVTMKTIIINHNHNKCNDDGSKSYTSAACNTVWGFSYYALFICPLSAKIVYTINENSCEEHVDLGSFICVHLLDVGFSETRQT